MGENSLGQQWPRFQELRLRPEYLELVRTGKKRSTIRRGHIFPVTNGLVLTSGERSLNVRLLGTDYRKTLGTLTDDDARGDGFDSLTELVDALRRIYPGITEDEPLTVVHFELAR